MSSAEDCNFICSEFTQSCFNDTSLYTCTGYRRMCLGGRCEEHYDKCEVNVDPENSPLKAPSPGVPAQVYPYCVPGIVALRDHCNATLTGCNVTSTSDLSNPAHLTGRSEFCNIICEVHNTYCVNYTRLCTDEHLECDDMAFTKQCRVEEGTTCSLNVTSRTERYRINPDDSLYSEKDPMKNLDKYIDIDSSHVMEGDDGTHQECIDSTEVPYNLECTYMGARAMEAFAPVVFEGRAYDPLDGVRTFLAEWDSGYKLLCEQECWYHLIKRTRSCWPKLPLQYFLPGSDYRTFELFLRNTTDMMCFTTSDNEDDEFGGNSCVSFFDPEHNLTKPHFETIRAACQLPEQQGKCSPQCNAALEDLKLAFGCCIGQIVRQFDYAKDWLALVNFDTNLMLLMLQQCHSPEQIQELKDNACDKSEEYFIAVVVVKYLMFMIGAIFAVAIVVMTTSFYWQLENEPLKKSFYHF